MKKLVGILIGLVIVLAGLLIYGFFQYKNLATTVTVEDKIVEKSVATKEQADKSGSNKSKTYQFQDIESMPKATSVPQAFERIFGKNRLFNDFKDYGPSDSYKGEIIYYLKGIFDFDNIPINDRSIYNPGKPYIYHSILINFIMKSGVDTRMEMIDFLHYLKFSGLTKNDLIKEPLPKDSIVYINQILPTKPEQMPNFSITMAVFPQIKPGMNTPHSSQYWSINSDSIEQMDFSDKQDILNNITMYGKFQ